MSYFIEPPKEYPQPTLVSTSFEVYIDSVVLGVKAIVRVVLKDITGCVVKIEMLTLEGESYQLWGTNDNYIIEWTRVQLGLPPI